MDLALLSQHKFNDFLNSFDNVLCDFDGVIAVAFQVLEDVKESLECLKQLKKNIKFVSNNTAATRETLAAILMKQGIDALPSDFLTPASAISAYLKSINFNKKLYVIGMPALHEELTNDGFIVSNKYGSESIETTISKILDSLSQIDDDVGAVIVCIDVNLCYAHLHRASMHLQDPNVLFITTGDDRRLIVGPNRYMIGQAYFQEILKDFTRRESINLGKPFDEFAQYVMKETGFNPARTLFVGDTLAQDIAYANRVGFKSLLVLTGVSKVEELDHAGAEHQPNYIVKSFGDLHKLSSRDKYKSCI